ncbi:MAG: hypothetical protein K8W52_44425 [Deltaproteobacteria bacterium]|nr:hypothetical protein [Deltaproteobacteria bacterium]
MKNIASRTIAIIALALPFASACASSTKPLPSDPVAGSSSDDGAAAGPVPATIPPGDLSAPATGPTRVAGEVHDVSPALLADLGRGKVRIADLIDPTLGIVDGRAESGAEARWDRVCDPADAERRIRAIVDTSAWEATHQRDAVAWDCAVIGRVHTCAMGGSGEADAMVGVDFVDDAAHGVRIAAIYAYWSGYDASAPPVRPFLDDVRAQEVRRDIDCALHTD